MPIHNVVITGRQAAFVEHLVAERKFESADVVVREALNLVELHETTPALKLAALRAAIQQGIDSSEQGEYTVLSSPEETDVFFDKLVEDAFKDQ